MQKADLLKLVADQLGKAIPEDWHADLPVKMECRFYEIAVGVVATDYLRIYGSKPATRPDVIGDQLLGGFSLRDEAKWNEYVLALSGPQPRCHHGGQVMDLSKLSPAPWRLLTGMVIFPKGERIVASTACEIYVVCTNPQPEFCAIPDAEFVALARNAFDVMMRRNWRPYFGNPGKWYVQDECGDFIGTLMRWPDPFTALVEADRWMKEHEAKKP